MKQFSIIVAADEQGGIGRDGGLPWQLPADLRHFRTITTASAPDQQNAVIMGRKTWESIPERFRPLPDRLNVVLTRRNDYDLPANVLQCDGLRKALSCLSRQEGVDRVFVIGGSRVYDQAITLPQCRRIYLTRVHDTFDCDTYFPPIPSSFQLTDSPAEISESGTTISFHIFNR
ncbi:MAG: dihydrofolate reductase [Candidatus Omnitrophota bacterium]